MGTFRMERTTFGSTDSGIGYGSDSTLERDCKGEKAEQRQRTPFRIAGALQRSDSDEWGNFDDFDDPVDDASQPKSPPGPPPPVMKGGPLEHVTPIYRDLKVPIVRSTSPTTRPPDFARTAK